MARNFSKCRKCKAEIGWMVTDQNKPIPVDAESIDEETKGNMIRGLSVRFNSTRGHVAHFATCPAAYSFRKRNPREIVEHVPVPYKD